MPRWIRPDDLLKMAVRDVNVEGAESAETVLGREPNLLIPVSDAAIPALELPTYHARLTRWESGEGPRLTGMREFVHALETLTVPVRVATVRGEVTTYVFLLDVDATRVLASTAIDPPNVTSQHGD